MYPQSMFWIKNMKKWYTLANPSFAIKSGVSNFKGVYITRTCFPLTCTPLHFGTSLDFMAWIGITEYHWNIPSPSKRSFYPVFLLIQCNVTFKIIFTHTRRIIRKINEPPRGKTNNLPRRKQRRSNREADQRLCFRFSDGTIPLLLTSEISRF